MYYCSLLFYSVFSIHPSTPSDISCHSLEEVGHPAWLSIALLYQLHCKGIPPATECNYDRTSALIRHTVKSEKREKKKTFQCLSTLSCQFCLVVPKTDFYYSCLIKWQQQRIGRVRHTQKTDTRRTHRHTVKHLNSLIACGEMGTGGCISLIFA